MMYACITVLRALALQDGPSEIWKDYTKFESHLEERMKTEVYTKVRLDVLGLRECCLSNVPVSYMYSLIQTGEQGESCVLHSPLPPTFGQVQRFGNSGNLRKTGNYFKLTIITCFIFTFYDLPIVTNYSDLLLKGYELL
jgi:hypothetical protein